MKIYQKFSGIANILVLAGVLIVSGCSPSILSVPGQNLPPDLQEVVREDQSGEEAALYKIPGSPGGIRSLAVSENGIYFVNDYDRGGFFAEETMRSVYGIAPARNVGLLAVGGDARSVYLSSYDDGVWRLSTDGAKPLSIGGPKDIEEMAASPDSRIVYARAGDTLWWWKDGEIEWHHLVVDTNFQEDLEWDFGIQSKVDWEGDWTVGTNGAYIIEVDIVETMDDGIPVDYTFDIYHWIDDEKGKRLDWNMGRSMGSLAISGDGRDVWMQSGALWSRGKIWSTDQSVLENQVITALLFDPREQGILYVGTMNGLYIRDTSTDWKPVGGPGEGRAVRAIVYHPRWQVPVVATDDGLYFIVLQRRNQPNVFANAWEVLKSFYTENQQKAWFWPITTVSSFLTVYIVGMLGLLLWAWRGGSVVFGRQPLIEIASRPLVLTPGLGRWALFLGYKQRLANHRLVKKASKNYFGLPAADPDGSPILPDQTGESLHQRITDMLGEQQPVLIVGKGGAGKSTLLARWAFLAIKGHLPLKGYIPVLITADYYEGNLIQAIHHTLRQRDGVAVNEKTVETQLQSGKFLILFDGISEVETDKQESLQEILRTARNADFRTCRFLLATRPLEKMPADVATLNLQPLSLDTISFLLPLYLNDREQVNRVIRQLQVFGEKPIEPLLFALALEQNSTEKVSTTRAELYERYFRRLLRVESDATLWSGWRMALEAIAEWSLLRTGKRGIGLPHVPLVDLLLGKRDGSPSAEQVVEVLRRYYHVSVKDELDLLNQLEAAGLLQSGRRWRFAHDTFEEYFAASRMVSYFDQEERWPSLEEWRGSLQREQEFLFVLDFIREMADIQTLQQILSLDLPTSWKDYLI